MKRVLLAAILCVSAPTLAFAAEGTTQDPFTHGSVEACAAQAATCTACHGPGGHNANPEWPTLAGQRPTYGRAQAPHFTSGQPQNQPMETPAWGHAGGEIPTHPA